MATRKNQAGSRTVTAITPKIMEQIISVLKTTFHGNVTLITQDFRLVQIERNEKIRPLDVIQSERSQGLKERRDYSAVRIKIEESCKNLEYGQVVIVIKEGKIVQIDRTEKRRFPELTGIYGDGI